MKEIISISKGIRSQPRRQEIEEEPRRMEVINIEGDSH
jgi:hypothetical protein